LAQKLTRFKVRKVSLVSWGANNEEFSNINKSADSEVILFKSANYSGDNSMSDDKKTVENGTKDDIKKEDLEAVKKQLADAEARNAELKKVADEKVALEKQLKEEKDKAAKIEKEATEKKTTLEKQAEENAKIAKDALAKADELEDKMQTAEFIKKAATMPALGKPEDVGAILKEISQKAPDAFAKLDPILKALDERVKQGDLFAEIGKSSSGPAAGSAEDKLNGIAKSYVEKGMKGGFPEAFTKACRENEDLYNQYTAEKRSARGR
jgi:hypothetical protein